jgi:hypothetical protein
VLLSRRGFWGAAPEFFQNESNNAYEIPNSYLKPIAPGQPDTSEATDNVNPPMP